MHAEDAFSERVPWGMRDDDVVLPLGRSFSLGPVVKDAADGGAEKSWRVGVRRRFHEEAGRVVDTRWSGLGVHNAVRKVQQPGARWELEECAGRGRGGGSLAGIAPLTNTDRKSVV